MKTVNPPSPMESDASLLARYAAQRDESAFRQLVERHAAMVLGVARRRTGDPALAEEAGQIVFTLLARKAPALRHLPPDKLGGWLHRTALLTAGNLLRSEMRRRIHHARYATENADPSAPDESSWAAALPLMDEAIDSLPEADRRLVVQHFYQRRTFREISTGTGRTEDAMRKRAVRALERLSAFFKRRGVTLSAGAIMSGLGARVTEAAPAGYAAATAATAVSKASSVSILTVISNTLSTMAISKITATAAAVAFLTPIGLHWSNGSTSPAENAKTSAHAGPAKDPRSAGAVKAGARRHTTPSSTAAARNNTLARFTSELARLTPPPADEHSVSALQQLVFALSEEELPEAFALLTKVEDGALGPVAMALTARWAEKDPAEALRMARTLSKDLQASGLTGALQVWARRDFDAAFAWACSQPDGDDRNIQLDAVYHDLMKRDPATALARLKDVPLADKRRHYRDWTLDVWRVSDPEAALAWVQANEPEGTREHEVASFIKGWAGTRPDLAFERAMQTIKSPSEREDTLRHTLTYWGMQDPAAALSALVSLPQELQTPDMARQTGWALARGDVNTFAEATRSMPAGEFRDILQASAADRIAATDITRATGMIAGIASPESRQQASMSVGTRWMKSDPAAARAWIEASPDIPAEIKSHLLRAKK